MSMTDIEQYRAGFEAWAKRTHRRPGTVFTRSHSGDYHDNRIAAKWAAWIAAKRDTSTSQAFTSPAYADSPVGRAIEADRLAFEAHIGYTPERIASTSHPWGWIYGWHSTQQAFRAFCNRSKDGSFGMDAQRRQTQGGSMTQDTNEQFDVERYRAGFEAWANKQGLTASERQTRWEGWAAAKREASTEQQKDEAKDARNAALDEAITACSMEPVAYLRWWARQYDAGHGNIGHDEGFEVCEPGDRSDDGAPAFPVYASAIAAEGASKS